MSGIYDIFHYTEDFVLKGIFKLKFYCLFIQQLTLQPEK